MDTSLIRGALIHGRTSLPISFTSSSPSHLRFSTQPPSISQTRARVISVRVSSSSSPNCDKNLIIRRIKSTASTAILATAVAALMVGKFSQFPARAEPPATFTEEKPVLEEELGQEQEQEKSQESPLSQFLESHSDAIDALKSLLQRKLEDGEDEEALKILERLVSAQPSEVEWKFLVARLLNEMGKVDEARQVFEAILAVNPLSFEALFENALLMDRCGEGEAVLNRLQEALKLAEEENKVKEARDVRLIMAQIQYLQKNVDEALRSYQELAKEDPKDFRPYFCQGVIYSLLDRNKEAREQFKKYHELCPKKFEVEGFLQTPLSRMKLFGTDSDN
ncbi:PREDICTED: protein SLOW GREEN 1, chloroplastic [Nelumbo nucifera]|uniref:Protein SLOW GREEN 1, chloroplastic n=1 Tax=Nelumbo nucifera TaxID=4432 RepID=A0A1U7ZEW9_NELNU|nr:PREDICTED: protein SLOW GREEN 1, chloroplastic [Nelumbo nucifera]